jgi:hypothetical protein
MTLAADVQRTGRVVARDIDGLSSLWLWLRRREMMMDGPSASQGLASRSRPSDCLRNSVFSPTLDCTTYHGGSEFLLSTRPTRTSQVPPVVTAPVPVDEFEAVCQAGFALLLIGSSHHATIPTGTG